MKFYKVLIRLSGSLMNEVWRLNVSAAEVLLINAIHGGSAVVKLKELSEKKDFDVAAHRKLRAQLADRYGTKEAHIAIMNSLFGTQRTQPLPSEVSMEDLTPEQPDVVDLEDAEIEDTDTATEPPPEKQSPADIVRASIEKLGWPLPQGDLSLADLRKELKAAQAAQAPDEKQASVL